MNNPSLYSKFNAISKSDAIFYLKNYFKLIKWQPNGGDNVLDVGCGSADITNQILLPFFPQKFKQLVAVDISEEMIRFAKSTWRHPKTAYRVMDIASPNIPLDLKNSFNHIFSFYCLHWIQDQRKAFANIHQMLKEGGDFLVTLLVKSPVFDNYHALAKIDKWKAYSQNMYDAISPYERLTDPVLEMRRILEETGFQCNACDYIEGTYVFPNVQFYIKAQMAVNAIAERLPDNLKEDYINDYMSVVRNARMVLPGDNGKDEKVSHTHKSLVISASKLLKTIRLRGGGYLKTTAKKTHVHE